MLRTISRSFVLLSWGLSWCPVSQGVTGSTWTPRVWTTTCGPVGIWRLFYSQGRAVLRGHGAIKFRLLLRATCVSISLQHPGSEWMFMASDALTVMPMTGLWAGNSGHVSAWGSHYYKDHAESGSLCCHLRPWWHLNLSCVLRLIMPGSVAQPQPGSVLLSMVNVATSGHWDSGGLGHSLW